MREIMLIFHFLGLAMGLGTSFGFMFLGIAASKMEKSEAQDFMLNAFALGKMGYTGITLLLISGGYLITPYWKILFDKPLLMAKLGLVLLLIIFIITVSVMTARAKKGEAEKYLQKIPVIGRFALLTTLAIVVLAVYVFH
jgi:uncharacterized membrane protein